MFLSDGQGKLYEKLSEISERLARVEVMMSELTNDLKDVKSTLRDHEARINDLESHKDATIGIKDILTWIVMTGIALWGVFK